MRRPLFGNGFPKRLLSNDGKIDVFDADDFTPQDKAPQAFAVTLFCWAWQQYTPFDTPNNLPTPTVELVTEGGTGVRVAVRSTGGVADVQDAEVAGGIAKPIKLLDRFIVRGDQKLTVQNTNTNSSVANSMQCFVYGYFEAVGEIPPSLVFRPLQPTDNLEAPFVANVVDIQLEADDTQSYADLHLLNSKYVDLLDINILAGYFTKGAGDGTDIQAALKFPDGTKLFLPVALSPNLPFMLQSRPFDYQPMMGPASGSTLIQAGFESSGTIDPGILKLSAYGGFLRR